MVGAYRWVRTDAWRYPPRFSFFFGPRSFESFCGLWDFSCFLGCGQLDRRCLLVPHLQHRVAGLGAPTPGLLDLAGLLHVMVATNCCSIVIKRSTSVCKEGLVVAAATRTGWSGLPVTRGAVSIVDRVVRPPGKPRSLVVQPLSWSLLSLVTGGGGPNC